MVALARDTFSSSRSFPMDYRYPPDILPFRREVRKWLEDNLDDDLRGLGSRGVPTLAQLDRLRQWNRRLADAGYASDDWDDDRPARWADDRPSRRAGSTAPDDNPPESKPDGPVALALAKKARRPVKSSYRTRPRA